MTDSLWALSASEQLEGLRKREFSSVELTTAIVDRAGSVNPDLNAICVLADDWREQAELADRRRAGGEAGELLGVPVSVKDLILTKGMRTTSGSLLYEAYVPDEDEVPVQRIRHEGAVVFAKTNVPEFGYAGVSDNFIFGPSRNPWDRSLTPGGSSGGAAAAVAAGLGSIALGSDGGGSLRLPAALCGVFSIKPTFGLVPLYPSCRLPTLPGCSSWESVECIGPITRTVRDSALCLACIAGISVRDRHSLDARVLDPVEALDASIQGLRIGWSVDLGYAPVDPEVAALTERAVEVFDRELGCDVQPVAAPDADPRSFFGALIASETDLSALRKLREQGTRFSDPVVELLDRDWTAQEFTDAAMARQRVCNVVAGLMERFDILLLPAAVAPAFEIGKPCPDAIGDRRGTTGMDWISLAAPFNLTGQPAASVPVGLTRTNLPVGLQVVGRRCADSLVLRACAAYESVRPWSSNWPTL